MAQLLKLCTCLTLTYTHIMCFLHIPCTGVRWSSLLRAVGIYLSTHFSIFLFTFFFFNACLREWRARLISPPVCWQSKYLQRNKERCSLVLHQCINCRATLLPFNHLILFSACNWLVWCNSSATGYNINTKPSQPHNLPLLEQFWVGEKEKKKTPVVLFWRLYNMSCWWTTVNSTGKGRVERKVGCVR